MDTNIKRWEELIDYHERMCEAFKKGKNDICNKMAQSNMRLQQHYTMIKANYIRDNNNIEFKNRRK